MTTNRPIIHAAAENLAQSPWVPLTMSSGWAPVGGHTPRVCKVGQIVFLTGAVMRQNGGYKSNIATVPEGYRPNNGTQFIGVGVSSRGTSYELYLGATGTLAIDIYNGIGDGVGMIMPIAAIFVPV
ncbi:MAG: hypothetical protein E6121_08235 [Varibaculum cambriense]|nr:hypothetical protein [Varibaculum cambriense]